MAVVGREGLNCYRKERHHHQCCHGAAACCRRCSAGQGRRRRFNTTRDTRHVGVYIRQAVIFFDSFRHVEVVVRFFSILFDMSNINSTCRTSKTTCRMSNSTCRTSKTTCRMSNSTCRMSNSILFDMSLFHYLKLTYVFKKFDTSWSVSSDLL